MNKDTWKQRYISHINGKGRRFRTSKVDKASPWTPGEDVDGVEGKTKRRKRVVGFKEER